MFFQILICILLLLLTFYVYRKIFGFNFFKSRGIPGPPPHWFYGNVPVGSKERKLFRSRKATWQWAQKYGPIYGYYKGTTPYLVVSSCRVLQQIYVKDFWSFQGHYGGPIQPDPATDLGKTDTLFGVDLLFAWGQHWKRLRFLISPAFSSAKVKSYESVVAKYLNELIDAWSLRAEANKSIDCYEHFKIFTLSTISELAFGIDFTGLQNTEQSVLSSSSRRTYGILCTFMKILLDMPLILRLLMALPGLVRPMKWYMDFQYKRFGILGTLKPWADVSDLCKSLIDKRLAQETHRNDILQSLLDNSVYNAKLPDGSNDMHPLTRDEIAMSMMVLFGASLETLSLSLALTTYLLAKNPEVQDKLYREVASFDMEGDMYQLVMTKIPYLEWVVNEAMRLYPPVPDGSKFCVEDTALEGIYLPAGFGWVSINAYAVHRDPDVWGPVDVERFYPERFSPDYPTTSSRPDVAFIPFGHGFRNCVAKRLAEYMARLTMLILIRKFRFESVTEDEPPCDQELFLIPTSGVPVKAIPRSL